LAKVLAGYAKADLLVFGDWALAILDQGQRHGKASIPMFFFLSG